MTTMMCVAFATLDRVSRHGTGVQQLPRSEKADRSAGATGGSGGLRRRGGGDGLRHRPRLRAQLLAIGSAAVLTAAYLIVLH